MLFLKKRPATESVIFFLNVMFSVAYPKKIITPPQYNSRPFVFVVDFKGVPHAKKKGKSPDKDHKAPCHHVVEDKGIFSTNLAQWLCGSAGRGLLESGNPL